MSADVHPPFRPAHNGVQEPFLGASRQWPALFLLTHDRGGSGSITRAGGHQIAPRGRPRRTQRLPGGRRPASTAEPARREGGGTATVPTRPETQGKSSGGTSALRIHCTDNRKEMFTQGYPVQ